MNIFEEMERYGHEQVVFCYDAPTGLKAIIAIHDTSLGPAAGGCRMYPYPSEEHALRDVLRLSAGMTLKNAAAGLDLGGSKCVLWGDPSTEKSEAYLRAFGRFVETLGGRVTTGCDVGTKPQDFVCCGRETSHLCSLPIEYGGSGDTGPLTALGVLMGMKAAAKWVWGSDSLRGKRVVIQGVGKVGYALLSHLIDEGATCIITDLDPKNMEATRKEFPDIETVDVDAIFDVPCDIFSPNAMGAILNAKTIPRLKCSIIGGSANNQLAEPGDMALITKRGILYCPDFVINAGGVIQVADECRGYNKERALSRVWEIYERLLAIFQEHRDKGISTQEAAVSYAERRIRNTRALSKIYVP
ncbi:MAG: Leucine dehydrogenase [Syntrophorhabdus sp. PtaU1.Bin050]|nr:MAG: Leucine dehydrogenase [Syntrophorhabdus sp. PtaU1.Bin050]